MRKLTGTWALIVSALSGGLVLFHLYTTAFGILSDVYQRNTHLGLVLTLCFILKPATDKSPKDRIPFYDLIFIALTIASAVHVTMIYDAILWDPLQWTDTLDIVFAVTTTLLVLEAGRRTVGWVFIVLVAVFGIYALYGPYFPGVWGHGGFSLTLILQTFYHSTNGLWGTMTGISATLLAMFAIFSAVLSQTGGAETFVILGQRMVGKSVGGPGKVVLVASGLFGMISGSAMGNVMATGPFTIPMMKNAGYNPEWAAATEAVASTGGQIMPPMMGAGAFIMAQLLGVNYLDIAVAAAVPAFLYYLAAFFAIHFISHKLRIRGGGGSVEKITLDRYLVVCAPLGIFLFFLLQRYTVELAAFWAAITGAVTFIIVFAVREKNAAVTARHSARLMHQVALEAAASILSMAALLASAQLVITLIQLSGFGIKMSDLIVSVGANNLFPCLILSMLVCAILGMGLPTTAAYVLAAAVLAPPLIGLGVKPLVAHLFVFYYATLATITPPVCGAVFLTSGIAGSDWLKTGFLAVMIALPVFIVPYAFVYNQILILDFTGEPVFNIVVAFITAILGVISMAMGVAGFNKRNLNLPLRGLSLLAGILLIVPMLMPSMVGLVLFGGLYLLTAKKEDTVAAH